MACDCLSTLDKRLADAGHNTKISRTFPFYGDALGMTCTITTQLIEKKRGAKPLGIIPTYCPFCGTKYQATAESTEQKGAAEEVASHG